jgi:hypothetical protein
MNPFLNPYMTQQPINGNLAVYMFAAQQANGGIGSGRLSGTRPARPTAPAAPAAPSGDGRRASDIPGANAARYFNREYQPPMVSGRYYTRQGRYFPSDRR